MLLLRHKSLRLLNRSNAGGLIHEILRAFKLWLELSVEPDWQVSSLDVFLHLLYLSLLLLIIILRLKVKKLSIYLISMRLVDPGLITPELHAIELLCRIEKIR